MNATPPIPRSDQAQQRFWTRLDEALAAGRLIKLVLARPAQAPAADGAQRVVVRPLQLKGQACLSFVTSHATRDITKNWSVAEGLAHLRTQVGVVFRNAHLLTPGEEAQLVFGKRGTAALMVAKSAGAEAEAEAEVKAGVKAQPVSAAHDREKQRWIDIRQPFLTALGVTTPQGALVPAMARKWKQINKFVEVFAHALSTSRLADAPQVRVADFGAGRGYLTFAIHDWLQRGKGLQAQVTGVELRPDLVTEAQATINRLGLQGLRFEAGDVQTFAPAALGDKIDVVIALHACDTATDHAIHLGLKAGADIILCSPCCHKQIRPQLLSPHPLRPVFQHGIHAEQQAEMLTDSLRALLLEASGYDTQVFEFIALEHTRKNKMILAVKRKSPNPAAAQGAWTQVDELKRYFGIREQALESLLRADAVA